MDQVSLYEFQSDRDKETRDGEYVLKGRDDFVIEFIKSHVHGRDSRKLDIAEISIGDGRLSEAILKFIDSGELTCVDISATRIHSVRDRIRHMLGSFEARAHFLQINLDSEFDLLTDEAFDVVLALDIMEHVFDVFNFMEHCGRILRNRGTLILRVPNVAYIKNRLNLLVGTLPVTASWFGRPGDLTEWRRFWGWDGLHLHLFTIPILVRLLGDYGFSVQLCRDAGARFEVFRNLWPNMLYSNPIIIAKKSIKVSF